MLGSSDEEVPKKRASRKRAVSSMAEGEMRTPRRRVVRKSAQAQNNVEIEAPREPAPEPRELKRKAPTELKERSNSKNKRRNQLIVTLGILIVGVGASAAVGFTDRGVIDVNKVVEERNERIRAGGGNAETGTEIIPVQNQNTAREADGGLRPADPSTIEPPPATIASTTATSTATSTDANASSTEMVGDESSESGEPEASEESSTEATAI